jgi:hypothetical protein
LLRSRFELLYGEGAVELDSLEALHPGTLKTIVRKAVPVYRDESIQQRLADTNAKAKAALRRKWQAKMSPIEERASAAREAAVEIADAFDERLAKLSAELQRKLKPHEEQMAILQREAQDAVDELLADFKLPKRPAPIVPPDAVYHLFDSRRPYSSSLRNTTSTVRHQSRPAGQQSRRRREQKARGRRRKT